MSAPEGSALSAGVPGKTILRGAISTYHATMVQEVEVRLGKLILLLPMVANRARSGCQIDQRPSPRGHPRRQSGDGSPTRHQVLLTLHVSAF